LVRASREPGNHPGAGCKKAGVWRFDQPARPLPSNTPNGSRDALGIRPGTKGRPVLGTPAGVGRRLARSTAGPKLSRYETVVPRIVGYLSFYDGLASKCDPSYTLEGGNPGATTEQQAEEEELLASWYLSNGTIVTIPDFEGTGLDWMAGHESGYGTLDGVPFSGNCGG
jgi:hypothetical protein